LESKYTRKGIKGSTPFVSARKLPAVLRVFYADNVNYNFSLARLVKYFYTYLNDNIKGLLIMKIEKMVKAFAALSQITRIQILIMIINSGTDGICPCNLIKELKTTNANLSFHLKELENAELVGKMKQGKFIHYYAKCDSIQKLMASLIKNCKK
jgi:ArsR family transcriptional regulator, arsenate/arsenite/antimonite-responsive transcriptional repressor